MVGLHQKRPEAASLTGVGVLLARIFACARGHPNNKSQRAWTARSDCVLSGLIRWGEHKPAILRDKFFLYVELSS